MAQFSLYKNRNRSSRNTYPYFIDVQNSLLDSLNTRLVIPLARSEQLAERAIGILCPVVEVDGERLVLLTQQMTNVPVSALGTEVASLAHRRDDIVAAIDFLVTGI